jgi:hypothetical protein
MVFITPHRILIPLAFFEIPASSAFFERRLIRDKVGARQTGASSPYIPHLEETISVISAGVMSRYSNISRIPHRKSAFFELNAGPINDARQTGVK